MAERRCEIPGCERSVGPRAKWCAMHYQRWYRYGDPLQAGRAYGKGAAARHWRGDDVGYVGAHSRVRSKHGSAASHLCAHCGAQADDWAYDHADPNEKQDRRGAYSPDPSHYFPLCRPCHRAYDKRAA